MLLSYTILQINIWWVLHIGQLFWRVIFPFHSGAFEKSGKMKKVHITSIIVGVLLPLSPIVTSMTKFAVDAQKITTNETSSTDLFLSGGLGFNSGRFPPLLCVFYSSLLPLDLVQAIGCTMLLIIILRVYRVRLSINIVSQI